MPVASVLQLAAEGGPGRGTAIRVPLGLSPRLAKLLVAGAAAGWTVLVLGTVAFDRYIRAAGGEWSAAGWPKVLLVQLHVGSVNTAAPWFASMLRLCVGLGAALCFLVDGVSLGRSTRAGRVLRFGWLAVAAGFAALSLAGLGSLADRIEAAQARSVLPSWGFVLLGAIVLAAVASAGLFVLVRASRRPLALAAAILGVSLTAAASVAAQEAWTTTAEGLELLSSVAFLAAVAVYLVRRPGDPPSVDVPLYAAVASVAAIGATAGAAFVAFAALASRVPKGHLGIMQDWFTAAPAAAAAIGFAWLGAAGGAEPPRERRLYHSAAAFCAGVSLYAGAVLGYWLSELPHGGRLRPLAEGAMIAVAWILAWGLARSDGRWWGAVGALAWAALLSLGLADSDASAGWREAAAFGALTLTLLSHAAPRRAQNLSVRPPVPRQ